MMSKETDGAIAIPDFLQKMKGPERWEWFEHQKDIMAKTVLLDGSLELWGELLQGFVYMLRLDELRHCESITMHYNAVVVATCAVIEKDNDASRSWLLEMLNQADSYSWQIYENAQEFFDKRYLPHPSSQAEHRENIKKINLIEQEDALKFDES